MSIDLFGIRVLQDIEDALTIPWWVDFGTCLGAVRDSDFIPLDRDIDISAVFDHFAATVCIAHLKEMEGAKVSEHFRTDGCVAGAHFTMKGVRVGIHFWYLDSGVYIYEGAAPGYRLGIPKEFFESFEERDIRGQVVKVPSPPEPYMEFMYGPNWRVPNEKYLNSKEHLESRKRWKL